MKKLFAFMLCTVLTIGLVACNAPAETKDEDGTKLNSPFTECQTLEEAAGLAGFEITVPDTVSDYETRIIRAMADNMIEIIYEKEEDEVRIRKGAGSQNVSGDYNAYAESETVSVGDREVTLQGNDGTVTLATWEKGGYSYSVRASAGMASETIQSLTQEVE